MSKTTYNGWTNRETWLVNLWLQNDQVTVEYWESIAARFYANDPYCAVVDLADALKTAHIELMAEVLGETSGVMHDLLRTSLDHVNWDEIAKHYIDGAD